MLDHHYLDEDVSHSLVGCMVQAGYDMDSVKDAGNLGLTDARQLAWAVDRGRTIITHNVKDFRLLHEALLLWARRWDRPTVLRHRGIIVVPHSPVPDLVRIIDEFARPLEAIDNRMFIYDRHCGWSEYL
jgi:hypothetical protein